MPTKLSEVSSHGSGVAGTHLWLVHEEDQKKSSRRTEKLVTSPGISCLVMKDGTRVYLSTKKVLRGINGLPTTHQEATGLPMPRLFFRVLILGKVLASL